MLLLSPLGAADWLHRPDDVIEELKEEAGPQRSDPSPEATHRDRGGRASILRTLRGTICIGASHQEQCPGTSFDQELAEPSGSSSFDITPAVVAEECCAEVS